MNKILFISSNNTGNGHKSIAQALYYQFEKQYPDVIIEEVEAFELGGSFTGAFVKIYNKIAVLTPRLWGFIYKMGNVFKPLANFFLGIKINRKFIKTVKQSAPDLIVTVHPCFVGSVHNSLEKSNLHIPVAVFVADLDNVSYLWADRRSACTICPSKESYAMMVRFGLQEDKLLLSGFPTRDAFNHLRADDVIPISGIGKGRCVRFLIMNGSQGDLSSAQIAEILLQKFNCCVTILAGKDVILKKALEEFLVPKFPNKVTVCGFTDKVTDFMLDSDILLIRASPNVLMEAVNLCRPIIVIGAFHGQEEKNPEYVLNHNLGVVCRKKHALPIIVSELLDDDGKKLKEIQQSQINFRNPNAAHDIVAFLGGLLG